MLGINSIIGAGIFLTPGEVIGLAGPFAPMAYVLAGIFAGVVAIVFATAARYVRTNGASYAYTTAAFGRRIGIYVGVTHAITASIAWGVLASFFVSTLLRVAFPDKAWADAEQLFSVKTLTFLGFIGVLLAINLFGNRAIKWANGTSTVGKAFALSAFIVGGLWIITTQHVNNYATAWSAYSATPYSLLGVAEIGKGTFSSMALATIVALYAFTGFESIANAAEEMDAPDHSLSHDPAAGDIGSQLVEIGSRGLAAGNAATMPTMTGLVPAGGEEVSAQAVMAFATEAASMIASNTAAQEELMRAGTALTNIARMYGDTDDNAAGALTIGAGLTSRHPLAGGSGASAGAGLMRAGSLPGEAGSAARTPLMAQLLEGHPRRWHRPPLTPDRRR